MNESKKELAQYLKLNCGLRYKNGNFVPSQVIVDGELELEKYTDQILIYEPIQDNLSDNKWDLFANKYNIKNNDNSFEFEKIPLIAKTDVKLLIPVLRITYFGDVKSSIERENYQDFLSREVLVGGFLIIRDALDKLDNSLEFDRLKAHISWAINEARWECKNLLKSAIMHSKLEGIEDLNGNPIHDMKTLTDYLDQLYKFETATIISYEKVVPIGQKINNNLLDIRLIPGITNYHKETTMKCWAQDNIYLNLPFWIKEYQLNHGMVMTSYGLVPGIKPVLDFLSVPSIKREKKIRLKVSTIRKELLHSKIYIDEIDIENLPFLSLDITPINAIQYNIFHGEVIIIIWDKQISKPSQQLIKEINGALDNINPYKSLTKIFSEYGHVICTEITMGGRLGVSAVSKKTQEKFCQCLECIEWSEWSDNIILKYKDLLEKFNLDDQNLIAHNNSDEIINEPDIYKNLNNNKISTWLNNISGKPNSWSLANQPKLIPLYEIFDEEIKRQIDNLLENKKKILMTGVTKLSSNKTRYYRVEFENYLLTSDDYQVIGSVILNNEKLDLSVKFQMKSISGFSIIIEEYKKLDKEINGDLEVVWQLIGEPKSVGYFSKHTRNITIFNTEFEIEIPGQKISHQTDMKEELSPDFIIATSIQYPPTNHESMLQVVVKSWSGKTIDLDIINYSDDFDTNTQDDDSISIINGPCKVFVHLYAINPNQQKSAIADFGIGQVSWKLIGHELADLYEPKIIPFAQFIPLIKYVAEILKKLVDSYSTAQHNKRITKLLIERAAAANSAISILREDDLYTLKHYLNLQSLTLVLQKMENYTKEITQYGKVQKLLRTQTIESSFTNLCEEYETSIRLLNLTLMADFKVNAEKESKILQEDVKELTQFQNALATSITDKMDSSSAKICDLDQNDSYIVEKINEIAITMQNLVDRSASQMKIDNIFHESPLPFDDYEETEIFRGDSLRKYIHIGTKEEFAFKIVKKDRISTVTNQVTILKRLKDCQNIIHFYGITYDGYGQYYLITEWAENKNLREYLSSRAPNIEIKVRLGFAYDIAKGLNFLNAVKVVHRDIRSENIVITDRNIAKITNFRVSRGFEAATGNLAVVGECVRHSSPEMLRRGMTGEVVDMRKKYDTKCEVYSFGILLWEIAECRIPYSQYADFMEITYKVINGYREPFTPNTVIPEKYQELVISAVDQNPGLRPVFSKMLTVLQDIFHSYGVENSTSSLSLTKKRVPIRKDTGIFNWGPFNYLTIDKAIDEHKIGSMDKSIIYKCFDAYANMGNPKAKYYKGYYIAKGWSDLTCSQEEKYKITAELYKEAADHGDVSPDAQLRYALMVMQGKGVKKNMDVAVEYLLKAANNDHLVAMFNVATYYFANNNDELGKYYMIMAASKKYQEAINYCKANNISYL